jgi:hypothetical protein
MRKYAGWLTLVIPPVGGLLGAYVGYVVAASGHPDPGGDMLQIVLNGLSAAAGVAALMYTPFESKVTRWICLPFYLVLMAVVMFAIEIAINGFHVRVM